MPAGKTSFDTRDRGTEEALDKQISLWVTGIMAGIGLAFTAVALYIALVLQGGIYDLPDKVINPDVCSFHPSVIAFQLVGRAGARWSLVSPDHGDRVSRDGCPGHGNLWELMSGFWQYSLIFFTLIMPAASARILCAFGITGIETEIVVPGRTNHLQDITPVIFGRGARPHRRTSSTVREGLPKSGSV
jgi:hypothetical protein